MVPNNLFLEKYFLSKMEDIWKPCPCSSLMEEGKLSAYLYNNHYIYVWNPKIYLIIIQN